MLNRLLISLLFVTALVACNEDSVESPTTNGIALAVYKTETCGCCTIWADYMKGHGYDITIHHPEDLNTIKNQFAIDVQWQSCHTAVNDAGYFFEGHIPERFVKQFLNDIPDNAAGLAVAGMPLGSPGMEVGDRFTPYEIRLLNKDGSSSVYAEIKTANDQF